MVKLAEMIEGRRITYSEDLGEYSDELRSRVYKIMCNSCDKMDMGVLSLSPHYDDMLMWAHYCTNHKGFVIALDTENDFWNGPDLYQDFRKVTYAPDRVKVPLEHFEGKHDIATFNRLCLTKHELWIYENEWRIFFKNISTHVDDKGTTGIFPIPNKLVKAVYVGLRAKEDLKKAARSFCKKAHCLYYEMAIHEAEYSMESVHVDVFHP